MSVSEKLWNGTKGVGKLIDSMTTAEGLIITAGVTGCTMGVGGMASAAMTPKAVAGSKLVINAAGTVGGTALAGKGAYDIATAQTPEEAQKGGTELFIGGSFVAASAATAKSTAEAAWANGWNVPNPQGMTTGEAMISNIKSVPNIIGQATGLKTPTPFTTVITASSPELKSAVEYMSKPNEAQATLFNPKGTQAEVLKNNPNVFVNDKGQYCVPNKWNPEQPYILDSSKPQVIMQYGADDFAVCDGGVFKGSYVNSQAFKENGALNYMNPAKMEYGKTFDVTKQARGAVLENVPAGTNVNTLEGIRTVQAGEVIAVDHAGNPYVTPMSNILKRNVPTNDPSSQSLFQRLMEAK